MRIPVVIEPRYLEENIWCIQICKGIAEEVLRKKYESVIISGNEYKEYDYESLLAENPRMVLLIGTTAHWIPKMAQFFAEQNIQVLTVCYALQEVLPSRGSILVQYDHGMKTVLHHLKQCGCRSVALYGSSDALTDVVKQTCFQKYSSMLNMLSPDSPVYYNNTEGLAACFHSFRNDLQRYDSVICVNDIAALSLLTCLREENISVPDTLQIVCFGNAVTTRLHRPAITSWILNNEEVGRQAVSTYVYLAKSAEDVTADIRITGHLQMGETTLSIPQKLPDTVAISSKQETNFYNDSEVQDFQILESLLMQCSDMDIVILKKIMAGCNTEQIVSLLDIPLETVRYRIKRILRYTKLPTREALFQALQQNRFGHILQE